MGWIGFTLLAAFSQAIRNLLQSKLTDRFDATAVTLSRFTYSAPMAIVYLLIMQQQEGIALEVVLPGNVSNEALVYCVLAALAQISGTVCLVNMFREKNYLVGAGLAKSEALLTGLLGMLIFSATLSVIGWLGVLVGTVAVLLLSGITRAKITSLKVVLLGLSCGGSFALTSLFSKEASSLVGIAFPVNAALVLCYVLCIQTFTVFLWSAIVSPNSLRMLRRAPMTVFLTSLTGFVASIGWFSAVALQEAAYVRTLGQVEVLISVVFSIVLLKQLPNRVEIAGLVLIVISSILVLLG